MALNPKPELDVADQQAMEQSLVRLDRANAWFWWNAVLELALLTAAIALVFIPASPALLGIKPQLDAAVLVRTLLIFMMLSNAFTLYHQRHLKRLRQRLEQQMQASLEQRLRADKFYGLAIMDPLTRLYNRRFGEERLQEELLRAERRGEDLAVLLFDLDDFKEINDTYGHEAGDAALKELSRRLKRAVRACDVPVRLGGDEFLVVLPECPKQHVDTILARLETFEITVNKKKFPVSFSCGRAQYQLADTKESIVKRADESLYRAKVARDERAKRESQKQQAKSPEPEEQINPLTEQRIAGDPEQSAAWNPGQISPETKNTDNEDAELLEEIVMLRSEPRTFGNARRFAGVQNWR